MFIRLDFVFIRRASVSGGRTILSGDEVNFPAARHLRVVLLRGCSGGRNQQIRFIKKTSAPQTNVFLMCFSEVSVSGGLFCSCRINSPGVYIARTDCIMRKTNLSCKERVYPAEGGTAEYTLFELLCLERACEFIRLVRFKSEGIIQKVNIIATICSRTLDRMRGYLAGK